MENEKGYAAIKEKIISFLLTLTDPQISNNSESKVKEVIGNKYRSSIDNYLHIIEKDSLSLEEYFFASIAIEASYDFIGKENLDSKSFNAVCINKISRRVDALFQDFDWEFMTELSCEKYEKKQIKMLTIVLSVSNVENEYIIQFDSEHQYSFEIKNIHGIRKVLEMLDENTCIVVGKTSSTDNYVVKGIYSKEYATKLINLNIVSPGVWECWIPTENGLRKLFKYRFNRFELGGKSKLGDKSKLDDESKLDDKLTDEYIDNLLKLYKINELDGINYDAVLEIFKYIVKELDSGAIVIFVKDEKDFDYLYEKKRAFKLNSPHPSEKLLEYMSKIDGAIICSYSGSILGYGAILDGKAKNDANLQRGSRYNSSKTYIDNIENSFGLVRSDDGMIDVIVHKP